MHTGISSLNATEKVLKTKKCINCSLPAKYCAKCSKKTLSYIILTSTPENKY